ncbi:MAG: FmdB family zinc ribbon protein [Candidatus Neomarinimicrobiota bacterium]
MPTYSYVCDACGHQFDRFQAITDEPVRQCPSCGQKRVRRLIGAGIGLIFKGSGFYLTDYARPKEVTSDRTPPGESTADGNGQEKAAPSGESPQDTPGNTESPSSAHKSDA